MNYILYITYPDGHVEEIEERFSSVEEAKKYAEELLLQVANTERYHYAHGDSKGIQKRGKASFIISKKGPSGSQIVFDSKKDK